MMKLVVCFMIALGGAAAVGVAREGTTPAPTSQAGYSSGNIGYDGKLAFVRLRYANAFAGFGGRRGGGRELPWAHDYPTADIHLMKIINDPDVDGAARRRVEHLLARRP